MERRFRLLLAFYGIVVIVMIANKKSAQERPTVKPVADCKMAAWIK